MRTLLTASLVLGLSVPLLRAEDKPGAGAVAVDFEKLTKDYQAAQKEYPATLRAAQKAVTDADTDDAKKEAEKKLEEVKANAPGKKFAPRFLKLVEANPKNPAAIDAIDMALRATMVRTVGGAVAPKDTAAIWDKAVTLLRANWTDKPEIQKVLRIMGNRRDEAAAGLLRDVMAKNSDRKVQAMACKTLANSLTRDSKTKKEGEELTKTLHDKYGDIYPDLSVGKMAPEIVMEAIDGKKAKLSALRGKVVVLDIWATWCGPCKAMIPHEREMVEKLKDKPFALVSISGDDKKKALTDFLEKEKMPWTHWWNGPNGGIMESWDIEYFPTIYVIDAKGVIRHKDLRGEKLEKAVEELLKEMEEKK